MYKYIIRIFAIIQLMLLSVVSFAQENTTATETVMRSNGKIYVVMAVVVVIVLGLFLYLFNLDRKISKLEKNSKP